MLILKYLYDWCPIGCDRDRANTMIQLGLLSYCIVPMRSLDVNLESISEKRLQDKALFFIYKLATLE